LVWVSRGGTEQTLNPTLRNYATPRIAGDGRRVVVQAGELWLQDTGRSTFTRLPSTDSAPGAFPVLTPDGKRVVYRAPEGVTVENVDGTGKPEVIPGSSEFDYPASFSPDGETLVFLRNSEQTSFDVYTLPLRNPTQRRAILNSRAYEGGGRLSPDGRWLLYVSNESGRNEVYLRPFSGPERRWQISTDGGTQAIWNPNGKEIFYRSADKMMAVELKTMPDLVLSSPRVLFERRYAFGAGITLPNYDVTPDGQRFVMVKEEDTAGRLNIVLNWFANLAH
jgi:Tol biopolymer transport system component